MRHESTLISYTCDYMRYDRSALRVGIPMASAVHSTMDCANVSPIFNGGDPTMSLEAMGWRVRIMNPTNGAAAWQLTLCPKHAGLYPEIAPRSIAEASP
jgi:hypothetical protein